MMGGQLEILTDHLKIELKYAENSPEELTPEDEIIPPPQEILKQILNAIRIGDIDSTATQITEVSTIDSGKYQPFAGKMKLLADGYKLTELENFINQFLQR